MTKEIDKICSYCKKRKTSEHFKINKNGKLKSRCIDCNKVYQKNYHSESYRFITYNISKEVFDIMLENQSYRCKICEEYIDRNCHIDHDHKTMKVRGLLCPKCNKGLGLFNDDIIIFEKALNYLKQH